MEIIETVSPKPERLILADREWAVWLKRWTLEFTALLFVILSLALDKATGHLDPLKLTVNINAALGKK